MSERRIIERVHTVFRELLLFLVYLGTGPVDSKLEGRHEGRIHSRLCYLYSFLSVGADGEGQTDSAVINNR